MNTVLVFHKANLTTRRHTARSAVRPLLDFKYGRTRHEHLLSKFMSVQSSTRRPPAARALRAAYRTVRSRIRVTRSSRRAFYRHSTEYSMQHQRHYLFTVAVFTRRHAERASEWSARWRWRACRSSSKQRPGIAPIGMPFEIRVARALLA